MAAPEWFAYQSQKVDGAMIIVTLDYTLDPDAVDPTLDLRVYADVLTLPAGVVSLPGRRIELRARKIVASGGTLETSGGPPPPQLAPMNPPQAPSGQTFGVSGDPGKAGGSDPGAVPRTGQGGGQIDIFAESIEGSVILKSIGGKGQQGQNGQRGGDGFVGDHGRDGTLTETNRERDEWKTTPATPGLKGGNAGRGGDAGPSGKGGDGGVILVRTLKPFSATQVTSDVSPGPPGDPAQPGPPGIPGGGGHGGDGVTLHCSEQGGHIRRKVCTLVGSAPSGPAGDSAAAGKPAPTAAAGGAGRSTVTTIADPTTALLFDEYLLSQYLLMLHKAELSYLASDFAGALAIYGWLEAVTRPVAAGTAPPDPKKVAGEYASINQQARALIAQVRQGLDYFGNPLNYVPIVSLAEYQNQLGTMLALGDNVERTYDDYAAALKANTSGIRQLTDAIQHGKDAITAYQANYQQLVSARDDLIIAIEHLTDAQISAKEAMLQADEAFQEAVAAVARRGCGFSDLLTLVTSLVSVTASLFDMYSTEETAFNTASMPSDLGSVISNTTNVVSTIQTISGDASAIGNSWNSIKSLNTSDAPDTAKLVLQEDDFDQAIAPFLGMPEAENYKTRVHDYVGVVQARNAKLLAYTNVLRQLVSLDGQIRQKTAEVERIEGDRAFMIDPTLAPYRTFLYRLYEDLKLTSLKFLYQENQAYRYWSQTDSAFSVADNTFADLEAFHQGIQQNILAHKGNILSPEQPLNEIRITLRASGQDNRAEQFTKLRSGAGLSFELPIDDSAFLGWANVLATSFRIVVNNARSPRNQLYVQLWHHGKATIVDPRGIKRGYTHDPVLAVYEYHLDNSGPPSGGSLGGSDGRIALSPFGVWTITVPLDKNPGVDLSAVDDIDLYLSGYALPTKDKRAR